MIERRHVAMLTAGSSLYPPVRHVVVDVDGTLHINGVLNHALST